MQFVSSKFIQGFLSFVIISRIIECAPTKSIIEPRHAKKALSLDVT